MNPWVLDWNWRYWCQFIIFNRYRQTNKYRGVCARQFHPLWRPGRSDNPTSNKHTGTEILASKCHSPVKGSRIPRKMADSRIRQEQYNISPEHIPVTKSKDMLKEWWEQGHSSQHEWALVGQMKNNLNIKMNSNRI